MTDRPVIFSGPMVRALLAGRKTQTRRLASSPLARCAVGDRLYVREAAAAVERDSGQDGVRYAADGAFRPIGNTPEAAEAWGVMHWYGRDASAELNPAGRQVPSIHMPRWTSRLTLIVENVRVEPLQAISLEDAWAEGVCVAVEESCKAPFGKVEDARRRAIVEALYGSSASAFHWLWNTLHGRLTQRWADNPDVVALTFRVIRGNIDQDNRHD